MQKIYCDFIMENDQEEFVRKVEHKINVMRKIDYDVTVNHSYTFCPHVGNVFTALITSKPKKKGLLWG